MKCLTCNGTGEIDETNSFYLAPEHLAVGKWIWFADGPHEIVGLQFPMVMIRSLMGLTFAITYCKPLMEVTPEMLAFYQQDVSTAEQAAPTGK